MRKYVFQIFVSCWFCTIKHHPALALLTTHYSLLIGVKITLQYGPSHWINYILSKLHYSTALPAELITGW